jgi:hypothetical protein
MIDEMRVTVMDMARASNYLILTSWSTLEATSIYSPKLRRCNLPFQHDGIDGNNLSQDDARRYRQSHKGKRYNSPANCHLPQ